LAACLDVAWCEVRVVPAAYSGGNRPLKYCVGNRLVKQTFVGGTSLRKELGQIRGSHRPRRFNQACPKRRFSEHRTRISAAGGEITNAGITAALAQLVSRWFAKQG